MRDRRDLRQHDVHGIRSARRDRPDRSRTRTMAARRRRDLANAQWLADQVRATAGWRVLAPVALQTLCIRHEPPGVEGDALDRHTLAWIDRVNRSGAAYLTPAVLDGRWMARVSIGAEQTERSHVEVMWRAVRAQSSLQ